MYLQILIKLNFFEKCIFLILNVNYIIKVLFIICKLNICEKCINQHSSHQFIHFSKIGLNNEEINQIDILFKEIEKNIKSFNKLKNDIQSFLNEMKLIKENKSIYENDEKNNYKKYYNIR